MIHPGMMPPGGGGAPASPGQVALLARMLHGGPPGGPGGPPPPGEGADTDEPKNGKGLSPLEGVQSVIQDLHDLARIVPDPQAVKVVTGCLNAMAGLQAQLMQSKGGQ